MSELALDTNWREAEALYNNHYQCPHCAAEWHFLSDHQPDEDCPTCGLPHISPIHSETI